MGDSDEDRAKNKGNKDCEDHRGQFKLVFKVVTDSTGEVDLLAEDVLGKDAVEEGKDPYGSKCDLVHHEEAGVQPVLVLRVKGEDVP